MENKKYIIISLDDAKYLATHGNKYTDTFSRILGRFEIEEGADILEIAKELKSMPICGACSIECQEENCNSIYSRKLGRRLARLIERANQPKWKYEE